MHVEFKNTANIVEAQITNDTNIDLKEENGRYTLTLSEPGYRFSYVKINGISEMQLRNLGMLIMSKV